MRRALALVACVALTMGAGPAPKPLAFIACPILRDTKTVPCWLTEHGGKLYYLGIQTDVSAEFNPPSLGHLMLVEGVPSDDPHICGGIVMKQVRVSVMQDRADHCNTMLPAEDRYDLPFEAPRPPGPSSGRLAYANPPPPPVPTPPFQAKSFDITYEFDGLVGFKHPKQITPVLTYARQIKASRIEITGYRGATRLDDGKVLTEQPDIGARRANQIAELLRGSGLTTPDYKIAGRPKADLGDWTNRKVVVVVRP